METQAGTSAWWAVWAAEKLCGVQDDGGTGGDISEVDSLGRSECTGKEEEPAAEDCLSLPSPVRRLQISLAWCLGSPRHQSLSPEVVVKHEACAFFILPYAFRERQYALTHCWTRTSPDKLVPKTGRNPH